MFLRNSEWAEETFLDTGDVKQNHGDYKRPSNPQRSSYSQPTAQSDDLESWHSDSRLQLYIAAYKQAEN